MGTKVSMIPRQLGPMMRMPYSLATASNSFSRATPSGPASRKPAVMMTAPLTPFSPHSRKTLTTARAGIMMTTMSIGPGVSRTDL